METRSASIQPGRAAGLTPCQRSSHDHSAETMCATTCRSDGRLPPRSRAISSSESFAIAVKRRSFAHSLYRYSVLISLTFIIVPERSVGLEKTSTRTELLCNLRNLLRVSCLVIGGES